MKRTTNTGALAVHALVRSDIFVRGSKPSDAKARNDIAGVARVPLLCDFQPLLFFPSADAAELTPEFVARLTKPVQLLVPDGNWRQASKVHSRHLELVRVPRVKISTPNLGRRHMRAEHTVEGMATLEAIAKAIGILESRDAETSLLELYRQKLERTLIGRQGRIDQSFNGKNN